MKLGEIVVHMDNYNFTKFHQNQMKNKKVLLIHSPFFCSEFQSVIRIVKIIHSGIGNSRERWCLPSCVPSSAVCKKKLLTKYIFQKRIILTKSNIDIQAFFNKERLTIEYIGCRQYMVWGKKSGIYLPTMYKFIFCFIKPKRH